MVARTFSGMLRGRRVAFLAHDSTRTSHMECKIGLHFASLQTLNILLKCVVRVGVRIRWSLTRHPGDHIATAYIWCVRKPVLMERAARRSKFDEECRGALCSLSMATADEGRCATAALVRIGMERQGFWVFRCEIIAASLR